MGNRKLEDGNLCKDCAKKLSPWFSERRHSTVAAIKEQLQYREENKLKVAAFTPTRTFGSRTRLMIDDNKRQFMVAKTSNLTEENPDVLDFSMARGCEPVIDEHRNEKKRRTNDGSYVSYNPPRFDYSYTFEVKLFVDHPYIDEIKFDISNGYIDTGENCMTAGNPGWTVNRAGVSFGDSSGIRKYNDCVQLGNDIKAAVENMRNGYTGSAQQDPLTRARQTVDELNRIREQAIMGADPFSAPQYGAQPSPQQYGAPQNGAQTEAAGSWVCPFCDKQNTGKFCEYCGAKRPDQA